MGTLVYLDQHYIPSLFGIILQLISQIFARDFLEIA